MELLQNYESSEQGEDSAEEQQAASDYTATSQDYLAKVEAGDDDQIQPRVDLELIQPKTSVSLIDSAPKVDITSMQIKKVTEVANRFYTENVVNEEKNHLTGHIEQTHVSRQMFE